MRCSRLCLSALVLTVLAFDARSAIAATCLRSDSYETRIPESVSRNALLSAGAGSPSSVPVMLGAGDGSFSLRTVVPIASTVAWSMVGWDVNRDGKPDLLLTDMHSDMSEEIGPEREKLKSRMQWTDEFLQGGANNIFGNALYHDPGGGKGEEVSDRMGVENYWPWGPSVGVPPQGNDDGSGAAVSS